MDPGFEYALGSGSPALGTEPPKRVQLAPGAASGADSPQPCATECFRGWAPGHLTQLPPGANSVAQSELAKVEAGGALDRDQDSLRWVLRCALRDSSRSHGSQNVHRAHFTDTATQAQKPSGFYSSVQAGASWPYAAGHHTEFRPMGYSF
jgi:hypothetical protein